ncbi:MAG: hypothetical protein E6R03_01330 [Hyphomicrobiaceae bacterium]|nr:MAG: hypothetical protein E6R03_01330 [Hyphomicrobiaceae bacterium]
MVQDVSTIKARAGVIAELAAGFLDDHMQFVKTIDKADKSDFGGMNGFMAGDTVNINVPAQFTLGTGADITSTIQDVVETKVPLTVNNQYNVPIAFTSAEIATDFGLKSWAKRVLEPQMITLANNVEAACLAQAVNATYNSVGTAGSTVFDTDTILAAGQKLDQSGCADYDNRYVLLNPAANRSAVNARKGLFQQSTAISEQYKNGAMGMADGFTFLRNNLLPSVTNGNDVVFEVRTTVNTQGQSTLVVEALTANTGTVKKGEVFTIAGVYAVHPVTKAVLPDLQQFVATADKTADSNGYATLDISPAMYTTGGQQNISAFPQDGAAITPVGAASTAYTQNLAYHKSAFRFVSLPLVLPEGVDMAAQKTRNGITVRIVRDFDVLKDRMIMRADILWGMANVRPQFASRITA